MIRQQPAKVCQQDVISFHLEGSPFGPCHNDMLQQGLPSCGWTDLLCSGTGAAKPLHHCWTRASRLWSCRSPRCRPEPPETQGKSAMDLPSSRYIDTSHETLRYLQLYSLPTPNYDDVYTESTLSCQSYHRALRMPQAKVACILSHAVNVVARFHIPKRKTKSAIGSLRYREDPDNRIAPLILESGKAGALHEWLSKPLLTLETIQHHTTFEMSLRFFNFRGFGDHGVSLWNPSSGILGFLVCDQNWGKR